MQAIFSDDSDVEEDTTSNLNKAEHPEKKAEAANTALSRLMAGDFLESLGKELGLEVPPEPPYLKNKSVASTSEKEVNENSRYDKIQSIEDNHGIPYNQDMSQDGRHKKNELIHGTASKHGSIHSEIGSSENKNDQVNLEKNPQEDRKDKTRHRRSSSSSSSEDERSRRHSRGRRHRSSDSDSDSSSGGRHHSRSKSKRKKNSREKSTSSGRRHSKHHDRRSRDSPSRSRHGSAKERTKAKREKH